MSERNGTAADLADARAELRAARLETRLEEARLNLERAKQRRKVAELRTANLWADDSPGYRQMRRLAEAKGREVRDVSEGNFLWDWVSGYQDLLDRLRSPDGLLLSAISVAADRKYGACWPFFRTWQEHALLRGASRILYQTSALARGAVSGLQSYIIGDGFSYRVTARKGESPPAALLAACQDVIDQYGDLNGWPALEAELLLRDVRDGEWYVRDFPQDDGTTLTRTVGPEQVIQPADSTPEEYSFGHRNPVGPTDVQTTLEYSVCYDGDNSRPEKVPASQMLHHKVNTDRDVKRGIPDLAYDTYDFLKVAGRLIQNMGEGSAIQAAVAEILQHETATADQARDFDASQADYQQPNAWTGAEENVRQVRPGERRFIPKGLTFVPPPFTQGSPIFIQVEQAVLRAVAVTWNAPEWLTSGDASNNNYSSSLTAESPFIKTGKRKQAGYAGPFTLARWRALRHYCEARRGIAAGGRLYSWEEARRLIDIQCEPPSPEVRNRLEEAQANLVRVEAGWKSPQTVQQEEGLESEREFANVEEFRKRFPGQPAQAPGGPAAGKPPAPPRAPAAPAPRAPAAEQVDAEHGAGAALAVARAAVRLIEGALIDSKNGAAARSPHLSPPGAHECPP